MLSTHHRFSASNPIILFPPPPPPSRRLPIHLYSSYSYYRSATTTVAVRIFAAKSPIGSTFDDGDSRSSEREQIIARLSTSAVFLLGLGALSWTCFGSVQFAASAAVPVSVGHRIVEDSLAEDQECEKTADKECEKTDEDEEMKKAFEKWKSKTFSLTVPLRVVSLRGSVPPSWIKDFVECQGKRSKLILETRGSLEGIFSEISTALSKGKADPKSAAVADIVTVGDSWLNLAINKAMIEPIQAVEKQDWFKSLPEKWKVRKMYL